MPPHRSQRQHKDIASVHHLETPAVLRLLEADLAQGLTAQEAQRRLSRFGPNRLSAARGPSEGTRAKAWFSAAISIGSPSAVPVPWHSI